MKATTSQEDYLETIYDLSLQNKEVRSIDVARIRNVSRASINKAITGLAEKGYIIHEPYGKLVLTRQGRDIAKEIRKRHNILKNFLEQIIGVSPRIAEEEACKIEHVIGHDTIQKICKYVTKNTPTQLE